MLKIISPYLTASYHDMGLLVPQYVDQVTSYRYYDLAQSKRLDMILQMKSVGLSLKQIKHILDSKDLTMFEAILLEQIGLIEDQVKELRLQQSALKKRLDTCKHFLNPPSLQNVFVEYQPKRKTYFFEIEPYDYILNFQHELHCWEKVLEQVKQQIHDYGMPITYFSDVGAIVRQEDIVNGRMLCGGAFILAEDRPEYSQVPIYEIQSGTYVCMYDRWYSGNSRAEVYGIKKLLAYINQEGFTICGDYIAEVIAESTVFDCDSHLSLIKMEIPVHIVGAKTDSRQPLHKGKVSR